MYEKLTEYFKKYREYILYLIFGVLTTVVNFLLYFVFTKGIHINYLASNSIAWVGAVLFAFITNKFYVFEAHDTATKNVVTEFFLFVSTRFLTFIIETTLLFIGVTLLGVPDGIVKVAVAVIVVILNFFLTRYVFNRNSKMNLHSEPFYKNTYVLYTLLFCIIMSCIFVPFFLSGHSLIDVGDGFQQHYTSAIYFSKYIREAAHVFLQTGSLQIPSWDNNLGLGQDVIQSLNYYILGDPLNLIYALIPVQGIALVFCFMTFLRLFLSGIAFNFFASRYKLSKLGLLFGSLMYALCAFGITYGGKHPFFINSMIYLPLMMLGSEKILQKEKPWLFIAMITIGGMSNFYFLFSNTLFTLAFCIARFIYLHSQKRNFWSDFAKTTLKFLSYYFVGILMATWILLPVLAGLSHSARAGVTYQGSLFIYNPIYYLRMGEAAFSDVQINGAIILGLTAFGFLSILLLFTLRGKKSRYLKVIASLSFLAFLTPLTSYILNGTTHTKNRWSFVIALIISFIAAYVFDKFKTLTKKQRIILTSGSALTIAISLSTLIIDPSYFKHNLIIFLISLSILAFSALLIWNKKVARILPVLMGSICLFQIAFMGYTLFSKTYSSWPNKYILTKSIGVSYSDKATGNVIKRLDSNISDYRYCAFPQSKRNYGMRTNTPGMSAALSLQPRNIFSFSHEIGNAAVSDNSFFESFDNRTVLSTLGNIKYLAVKNKPTNIIPFGFKLIKDSKNRRIYQNEYAVHKIFSYEKQLDYQSWARLSMVSKEQALVDGVLLQKENGAPAPNLVHQSTPVPDEKYIATQEEFLNKIKNAASKKPESFVIQNNKIIVKKRGATLEIPIRGAKQVENYFSINHIEYDRPEIGDSNFKYSPRYADIEKSVISLAAFYPSPESKNKLIKTQTKLVLNEKSSDYFIGPLSFATNLGYNSQPIEKLKFHFAEKGTYRFSSAKITAQPMTRYIGGVRKLNEAKISYLKISGNGIKAKIIAPQQRVAVLAVPYSPGWHIKVNGKTRPTYVANGMYIGFKLSEGENEVSCSYRSPGLKIGLGISITTLIVLLGTMILLKRNEHNGVNNKSASNK